MKIIEKENVDVPFLNLTPGTIFRFDDIYYLKVHEIHDHVGSTFNAMVLFNGTSEYFTSDIIVDKVPGTLEITQDI